MQTFIPIDVNQEHIKTMSQPLTNLFENYSIKLEENASIA